MDNKIKQRSGVNYGKIDWQTELPRLKKLVEEDKIPFEEISKIYNRPEEQIKVICTKYGIDYVRTNSKPWTEEEIDLVRELLLEGKTYQEISDTLGTRTRFSIRSLYEYHSDEYNLVRTETKRMSITEEETNQIISLLEKGYKFSEISDIVSVGYSWVKKVKEERNVKVPSLKDLSYKGIFYCSDGEGHLVRKETELTKNKIIELLENGTTISEISRIYGLDLNAVSKLAHSLGWKNEKLDNAKQLKYKILKDTLGREPTKEEQKQSFCNIFTKDYLINLLRKTDYNFTACGEELGIDPKGLHQAVNKLGIKIPDEIFKKSRSYGEKLISDMLSRLKIEYISQFRLDNAIPNRTWVFIDFCLVVNDITYWIEVNGRQHYDSNNCFTRSHEDFIDQVKRDMYLKKLAKNKGVVFLEIPYTFNTYDKIQDLLQRVIIGGEDINDIIDYTPFYKEIRELGIRIED